MRFSPILGLNRGEGGGHVLLFSLSTAAAAACHKNDEANWLPAVDGSRRLVLV